MPQQQQGSLKVTSFFIYPGLGGPGHRVERQPAASNAGAALLGGRVLGPGRSRSAAGEEWGTPTAWAVPWDFGGQTQLGGVPETWRLVLTCQQFWKVFLNPSDMAGPFNRCGREIFVSKNTPKGMASRWVLVKTLKRVPPARHIFCCVLFWGGSKGNFRVPDDEKLQWVFGGPY